MAHIHWISLVDQTIKHSSLEKKKKAHYLDKEYSS